MLLHFITRHYFSTRPQNVGEIYDATLKRSPLFELAITEPYDIYRSRDYAVIRRDDTYYITLRLPIQVKFQTMNLYKIIHVPIPLHDAVTMFQW